MRVLPSLLNGIFSIIAVSFLFSVILPASSADAYTADVNGARAYANDFCPDVNYPEDKIADFMWVTAPDGSNQVSVINGSSNQVDITINFFATYCTRWPQGYANGATSLEVRSVGVNRLVSGPGSLRYGDKTTGLGVRSEWGVGRYAGKLDVTGWGTGWHNVCSWFLTTTNRPGVTYTQSPSACFDIYLTRIDPWTTSGSSKVGVDFTPPNVSAWTARPNQVLYWRHTISAAGGTTPGLGFAIGKSGFNGANVWGNGLPANHNEPTGTTPAIGAGSSYSIGWGANRPEYSTYTVKASDGGRTLCQSISWGPTAYNNAAWTASNPACVTVPYNYNLLPSVTGPNGMGSIGSTIPPVTPRINNQVAGNANATTDSPANTEWQMKRIEVRPGQTIPMTQQENASIPCTHYRSGGAASCIDKGNGTQAFPAGSTTLALLNNEQIGPSTPAGTKICFTLSVRPYSQANGNWRHGVPVCITVSKQPKVQVWGSDVRSRGSIETGTTVISSGGSDRLFGSWVEYGGFSVGGNSGFASGSGLNNGNANTTTADVWNNLTFANINSTGASSYGRFTLPPLPILTTQFVGPASGGPINSNLGALSGGTYTVGNFTTSGGAIGQASGKGKTIIIVSSGTVTINGNITYKGNGVSDTFNSVDELPQVIVIARNINITNAATQIDAWLLTTGATGTINTCSDRAAAAPLNATVCNNQLVVNGPVVTEHLYLRRTAGSDSVADAGKPAEVFNLRPDVYLWAQARASQSGKAQTVYSVELPPRF